MASPAVAQPPSLKALIPFQKVEADRGKDYQLKEQNGPWLILVHAFGGEHAKADAHDLCLALRKQSLKAYVHKQSMNIDEKVDGLGFEVKSETFSNVEDAKKRSSRITKSPSRFITRSLSATLRRPKTPPWRRV
jgi:hypothetical protein